ncbi:MAG TPA: ABC transporter permease [Archangium sp.]
MGAWYNAEGMTGVDLSGEGEPERLPTTYVEDGFFSTLGVNPRLGRAIQADEHQPGRDAVVVISHGFWQRRFGGERSILGRSLSLNGVPHEVVGSRSGSPSPLRSTPVMPSALYQAPMSSKERWRAFQSR